MDFISRITIPEAARLCRELQIGMTENYIRRLVKQGVIPHIKIGKNTLIQFQDILGHLALN